MQPKYRKIITFVEEISMDSGIMLHESITKVAAIAIFKNPYAGKYSDNLDMLIEWGAYFGGLLAKKAAMVLEYQVESYGKGAIVGLDGEIEHAAAIMHPKLGKPVREVIGGGKAIMPATKKIGNIGTTIDVPIHYKDAIYVRSHIDTMTICVNDAPYPDEILLALVLTNSGRPLARIGGLAKEDAVKEDGLR